MLRSHKEDCIRIPMIEEARSLNLSNAVAIVAMEAMRQVGFPHLLKQSGRLFKEELGAMNTYDEAHALAKAIRECDEMKRLTQAAEKLRVMQMRGKWLKSISWHR